MTAENGHPGTNVLLGDLLRGFAELNNDPTRSVGLVGGDGVSSRPPQHCLETCLRGDAQAVAARGCAWLRAVQIGAQRAALVLLEGARRPSAPADATDVLNRLEDASRLVTRLGEVLEENSGLANEVIHNYEQLNLIFELTQQVAHVTDVEELERIVLRRAASLLHATTLCVQSQDGAWRTFRVENDRIALDSSAPVPIETVAAECAQVRRTRNAVVTTRGGANIIVGALVRLDERTDIVMAVRPKDDREYTAGDMLLVESVLAFGGQIISNTEMHERLRRMSIEVTRALVAAIDKKDHYTCGHSERVGFLSRMIGRELGLVGTDLQFLEWAGLLHDIGKIGIPEEILNKPGALTAEEFEVIKQHPRMGYEILKPIASFKNVLDGVLYHHEQPDGRGYPEGLEGDACPLFARIIHVADVFDALSSARSYRPAFSVDQAAAIICKDFGTRVDVRVGEAFLAALAILRREQSRLFQEMYPPQRAQPAGAGA